MKRKVIAPDNLEKAAEKPLGEPLSGKSGKPESMTDVKLMNQVLERENLKKALKQVIQNKGAPGIDGMTVEQLPNYLRQRWQEIRKSIEEERYSPSPVLRVEIPKGTGKKRLLGIPTVLDRFIQQAIAQVISELWESYFHDNSYGFRPRKSAHQALKEQH